MLNPPSPEEVDVVVLTRDGGPPPSAVRSAIDAQGSPTLRVNLHIVAGIPRPGDAHRVETIARARNEGRRRGTAPWLMFVDDDVALGPGCIAALIDGLKRRPEHAALAIDYLNELAPGRCGIGASTPHVALGASLFRRDVLAFLPFRWHAGKCECRCCADDLRRAGFAIEYLPGPTAIHNPGWTRLARSRPHPDRTAPFPASATSPGTAAAEGTPTVLATFNRAHFRKFARYFLASLRATGNPEPVEVYAYGLTPTEQRLLARLPGVTATCRPDRGVCPAITRAEDFAEAASRRPAATPLAYWDAGDVFFQARIDPLWGLVRADPDRLLAVREAANVIQAHSIPMGWVASIADPEARLSAFRKLAANPYLNSGFAAGTARTMLRYFRELHRLLHSVETRGTKDWGDQTALNLYCHADPSRWREISPTWNFTLCHLARSQIRVAPDGRVTPAGGTPVRVVHANARTLPEVELSHLHEPA